MTPPELGKVQDTALPTAHLAPQAIAAVVTMATAELGRVCQVTVHHTVQRLALQCTTVANIVIAVQMVRLCIQNLREDLDLSNTTLRQSSSFLITLLIIGKIIIFVMSYQPPQVTCKQIFNVDNNNTIIMNTNHISC